MVCERQRALSRPKGCTYISSFHPPVWSNIAHALKANSSRHSSVVAEFQLFDILANGVHEARHGGMKIYRYCSVFIVSGGSKVHEA